MKEYKKKKVLVLGGTGFIGTNLVLSLYKLGAKITVVSRGKVECSISFPEDIDSVHLDISTINPSSALQLHELVKNNDIIFDLAGRSGAVSSTHGPYSDLQSNVIGQYNLLETCRIANLEAHVVFLSTRLAYGKAIILPVTEDHPTEPTSFYGINKLTAEKYHNLFWAIHGVKTTILRVTVPYGPYKPIQKYRHGIINLFLEKAAQNDPIIIYGDGEQLRDVIYINDLIEALIKIPLTEKSIGNLYNLGSGSGVSLSSIATCICNLIGKGSIKYIDWPKDALQVETGDFYCSIDKISQDIDWHPKTTLESGIKQCANYYHS